MESFIGEYLSLADQSLAAKEILIILLAVPIFISLINFTRYIIGYKTLSIHATISTIILFFFLANILEYNPNKLFGITYGIIFILALYIAIFISYSLTHKIQLHYFPKISIILISCCIAIFAVLFIAKNSSDQLLFQMNPLNIVLLVIIGEEILKIYIKKGLTKSIKLIIGSTIFSLLCFLFIFNPRIQNFILQSPWIILFLIPINLLIGKYKGLRITEYFRFSDLLIESKKEEDANFTNITNTEE